jgi:hypothetical protein
MHTIFRFSKHAEERLWARGLSKDLVLEVLNNPDKIILLDSVLLIYQKILVESDKPYLYRVFVNQELDPKLRVTVYKTSKFDKYENQV